MCTLPHYICTIGSKCLHIHFKLSKSTDLSFVIVMTLWHLFYSLRVRNRQAIYVGGFGELVHAIFKRVKWLYFKNKKAYMIQVL